MFASVSIISYQAFPVDPMIRNSVISKEQVIMRSLTRHITLQLTDSCDTFQTKIYDVLDGAVNVT